MCNLRFYLNLQIVVSLTRFACVSPDYLEVMLHYRALEKVLSFVRDMVVGTTLMDNLAKFVAVVCRAKAKILLESEVISTFHFCLPNRTIYNN